MPNLISVALSVSNTLFAEFFAVQTSKGLSLNYTTCLDLKTGSFFDGTYPGSRFCVKFGFYFGGVWNYLIVLNR